MKQELQFTPYLRQRTLVRLIADTENGAVHLVMDADVEIGRCSFDQLRAFVNGLGVPPRCGAAYELEGDGAMVFAVTCDRLSPHNGPHRARLQ